ncbi:Fe-S protein assembly co-chaperone HscB [Phlyctema vagabunda]|uniref:Fe-S protein assembly co-chaperone HscB n=1 Tax=Phlyctema vagabunda TaxID=108571 RepID=A0ABR4P5Q0_9HELO
MRSSILPRSQQVYRACKSSTRCSLSSFSTPPSTSAAAASQQCVLRGTHPKPISARPQRRFQSTDNSSSSSSDSPAESVLKASAAPKTHYELFPKTLPKGPPPAGAFPIDTRELRREFLQLQAVAHPDRHAAELKTRAEATSAYINEAYKTLSNPLLRAQYLLGLRGIDVAEDETAKLDDEQLLMLVLETREEIEDVETEADLEPIRVENENRIMFSEQLLEQAFKRNDLKSAKDETVRLRYWVNIRESLDGWEKGKPIVLAH